MKSSRDLLMSDIKTVQMGQLGIRAIYDHVQNPDFKKALRSQEAEYNAIEKDAYVLAAERGWAVTNLASGARIMAEFCVKSNLMLQRSDSRIAAMMINGSTRGLIKSARNLNATQTEDDAITELSKKLLKCENLNIKQMQGYL